MKKMKKVFAVILSLAMVLGMSITSFADTKNTATITVQDAKGNASKATLSYAQVIKADQTKETGWAFVSSGVAQAYIDALKGDSKNFTDQDAIKALIQKDDDENYTVSASQLGAAQAAAANAQGLTFTPMLDENKEKTNSVTVSVAGVYLVKAEEAGFTYNIMAAYIGFGTPAKTEGGNYEYPSLVDTTLTEKKSTTVVDKIVSNGDEDEDNLVKTGDILTYTITTYVPYINPTDADKSFYVYDALDGAEYYKLTGDGATATLKLGESATNLIGTGKGEYTITKDSEQEKFSIDLSGMVDDANSNAGKLVTITYQVVVTSEKDIITNTAEAGHENGEEYGSMEVKTFEGNITLTKYGEKEDGQEEDPKLSGAEFEVRKDKTGSTLAFKEIKTGNVVTSYKYVPDSEAYNYTEAEDGTQTKGALKAGYVTKVVTGSNGTVKVQGLDAGTYYFKEVKAPKGYSVNTIDVRAEITTGKTDGKVNPASAVVSQTASMNDTKLSSLPSTGGIGTTIFTIAGCVIMIAAAGLFFASRKKSDNK